MLAYKLQSTFSRVAGAGDLQRAFEWCDSKQQGTITVNDVRDVFAQVSPMKFSEEEITELMKVVRTDPDGFVDEQLFTTTIMEHTGDDSDTDDESWNDEIELDKNLKRLQELRNGNIADQNKLEKPASSGRRAVLHTGKESLLNAAKRRKDASGNDL